MELSLAKCACTTTSTACTTDTTPRNALRYNMEPIIPNLNLAFYDASDGPRIMIFGPVAGCFDKLQELFRTLSKGGKPIEIHRLPFIRAFGDLRLVASCSGSIFKQPEGKIQGLRRKPSQVGQEFEWKRTAEGWDYLAELIDDLVRTSTPGHQYLSAYPKEDAIVVVSKGEYGDDILKQLENGSSST
jgi:hypothetical protein